MLSLIDLSLHQFARSYGMVNKNRFWFGWCRGTQFGTVRYRVVSCWVVKKKKKHLKHGATEGSNRPAALGSHICILLLFLKAEH